MAAEQQWFSNPGDERAVVTAWTSFLRGDERPAEALRALVDASWQRCLQAQVDPHTRSGPEPLPDPELYLLRERQRELLEAGGPAMACARDFLHEAGLVMTLADARCTILRTEGDTSALGSAETIRLVPGVAWSESACGTNGIGTALAFGQPVQIHSAEHFCEGFQRWTCSATVLRHPLDGEIVGVLNVSGLSRTYSRQTLALVVTAASRIESRLAEIELERRYRLLDRAMARLSGAGNDGIVLLDRRGCPIKANATAALALDAVGSGVDLACARRLPELAAARVGRHPARATLPVWAKPEWIEPLVVDGEHIGTLLIVPPPGGHRLLTPRPAAGQAGTTIEDPLSALVTSDPAMLDAIAKARQLSRSKTPVLLLGETGVGKEEFARGIHGNGGGPYVALNCGGLSRELLASELFGYADGAFTGARKGGMIGKIEAANGGTLFLDEIGEMPLDMQPNLLRVLEQREIYRLGENTARRVNFRLIAATHRDLRKDVAAGHFRMDLYYRIAVASVRIPPLRARKADIETLARHFLERFRSEQGQPAGAIGDDMLQALLAYSWPGNVRELRNVIEGAVLLSEGTRLTRDALPQEFLEAIELDRSTIEESGGVCSMAEGEEALIRRAISACAGNLTLAAKQLNIAKSTLYVKMQRYGLSRESVKH